MEGNVEQQEKRPLDLHLALERIEDAIKSYPKAALFELYEEGYTTVFEQLVACMISIRTRDETTLPLSRRLFERARTPAEMLKLDPGEIEEIINQSSFATPKSRQIHAIARSAVEEHSGELPCDPEVLLAFSGVGPKCANLALGIACGYPSISVDIHVHRVTNRWGYVQTNTPEQTTVALHQKVPERHWIDINRLLMPFGKQICTGQRPHCSTCPVLEMCRQVGVTSHR
jgi:endonuclease-3